MERYNIKKLNTLVFLFLLCLSGCKTSDVIMSPSGQSTGAILASSRVFDKENPKPTVIVGHGSGGYSTSGFFNSPTEDWASFLYRNGFNALIIDHYTKRGISRHPGVAARGAGPSDRAKDFYNLAVWARQQPWHTGGVGVVGLSQGGAGVLAAASASTIKSLTGTNPEDYNIKAFPINSGVGVYPACGLFPPRNDMFFPVLLHLGRKDNFAPISFCLFRFDGEKEQDLVKSNDLLSVEFYDAAHAWDSTLFNYNSTAVEQSMQSTLEFFKKTLSN